MKSNAFRKQQAKLGYTWIFLPLCCERWSNWCLGASLAPEPTSGGDVLLPAIHFKYDGKSRCAEASQDPGPFSVPGMHGGGGIKTVSPTFPNTVLINQGNEPTATQEKQGCVKSSQRGHSAVPGPWWPHDIPLGTATLQFIPWQSAGGGALP